MSKLIPSPDGRRVLIIAGAHRGEKAICLGRAAREGHWAVSPDASAAILELRFEKEFALLSEIAARSSLCD